ncbi:MAG: VIT family protein [Candidatus Omnitrophica bacterium]|nr:VIT family protein [Candidatus Omnitrophota bacterium]
MKSNPREQHRTNRTGWLRASVLGANDGILSTASLVVGVAAAHASHSSVLVAGIAGLVAGGMSMAAGEYVSVSSQADIERADLKLESKELKDDAENEHKELASIYEKRGLDPLLAKKVALQLMAHDALGAHAQDELGISTNFKPRPVQAALASAATFSAGGAMPLFIILVAPQMILVPIVFGATIVFLAGLGTLAAFIGGAPMFRAALRVTLWGALAMGLTAGVGALFGGKL